METAWSAGDIMLITDHIKLFGASPLCGPNLEQFGPRFPDMSHVYTPALQQIARGTARAQGPDAVGMSTVPEAVTAAHCGMQVLGFTLCTNMAAGVLEQPLSGDEVIAAGEAAGPKFTALVKGCLERM